MHKEPQSLQEQLFDWRAHKINNIEAPATDDPAVFFEVMQERLATGDLSDEDISEAMVPKLFFQPQGNDMTTTHQTAQYFSAVAKGGNRTWAPAMGAIAGTCLFNALTQLYNKHRWNAFQQSIEEEPTLDLRNMIDESNRLNDDGATQEEQVRKDQGFDEDRRDQQISTNIQVFAAAVTELQQLGPVGRFWIPDMKFYAPLARKFLAEPRRNHFEMLEAASKYTSEGELDGVKTRVANQRETELDEFSQAVANDVQAIYNAADPNAEIEQEVLALDPIRRHAAMVKTVEQLCLQRRFIMNDMMRAGKDGVGEGVSDLATVCETIIDVDDIAIAFTVENSQAFAEAFKAGRAVRALSDRPGKRNEPSPASVVKQLRESLNRPIKRVSIIKAEQAGEQPGEQAA